MILRVLLLVFVLAATLPASGCRGCENREVWSAVPASGKGAV
jgi:hypothetical protein